MFDLQSGVVFGMPLLTVVLIAVAILVLLIFLWFMIRKVPQERRDILLPVSSHGQLYKEMRSLDEKGQPVKRQLPSQQDTQYEVLEENGEWIKVVGSVKVSASTILNSITIPNSQDTSPYVNPPKKVKLNGLSFTFRDYTQPVA